MFVSLDLFRINSEHYDKAATIGCEIKPKGLRSFPLDRSNNPTVAAAYIKLLVMYNSNESHGSAKNGLIPLINQDGIQAVSARELHRFLEIGTLFTTWCNRMFDYGFTEGKDFFPILEESNIGRPSKDFVLTLDTAKEISMIQRNAKGKQAREYFIEIEKRYKNKSLSPAEQLLQNAQLLVEQERKLHEHDKRIEQLEAKTTTRPSYYTIAGFSTIIGYSIGLKEAARLGKVATLACKEYGYTIETCPDPRFGKVNMYPEKILKQVFEDYGIGVKVA